MVRDRRQYPRGAGDADSAALAGGVANPYAWRASSLASRFRLSEVALVIPVITAAVISSSQREMVVASETSSGMSSFWAHQS